MATSATAALLFARLIPTHSLSVAIVVDSLLVLFIGNIIPKTIAVNHARALAQAAIMPLHIFSKVSRPVVTIFDHLARVILCFLKVPEEPRSALSPSELEGPFNEADRKKTITSQEQRIARNIMRFAKTAAEEVMAPRVDIVASPLETTRDKLEQLMTEACHSRIPICEGSLDHIVGFVSTKEFFLNPDRDIRSLLKPVAIFPEGARVHRVFRYMQRNLINMAVIVNEYGVTSGSETALVSASRIRLQHLASKGLNRAHRALGLLEEKERILVVILIATNVFNIATGTIAMVALQHWPGSLGPIIATVAMTCILLVLSEIVPKAYFRHHPEQTLVKKRPLSAHT